MHASHEDKLAAVRLHHQACRELGDGRDDAAEQSFRQIVDRYSQIPEYAGPVASAQCALKLLATKDDPDEFYRQLRQLIPDRLVSFRPGR